MREAALDTAFGCAIEQVVEVLLAHQEHVLDDGWRLLFGFSHIPLQKCKTRLEGGLRGTKSQSDREP